jgi:uncharacterized surface protein with fasciclin (FAS1) repeats
MESPPATPGIGGSVYDTIVKDTFLSKFQEAIILTGMADELDDETREFTIFAPVDAAFEALNTGDAPTRLDELMADTDALRRLLQYHIVAGSFDEVTLDAAAAVNLALPTLIEGESLAVTLSDTSSAGLAINGVDISMTDQVPEVSMDEITSGIVHTIVGVLDVPEATGIPVAD